MDTLDLSEFIKTKSQATDFSAKLDALNESIFKVGFDLETALSGYFSLDKKDKFLKLCRDNNVNIKSPSDLKAFFEKLQDKVREIKIINLTLAFEPNDKTLKKFIQWFQVNMQKEVLFEIEVDPRLVAGAVITYNGKYQDYSLRKKVDQYFNPAPIQQTNQTTNSNQNHANLQPQMVNTAMQSNQI